MTTCDPSKINENSKKNPSVTTMEPIELFTEHDVDYILSQLTNPVDPQLIRDTLTDNGGDIDQTITYLLTIDTPVTPQPPPPPSDDSIEKIMSITGIDDVELVQQSYTANNLDIDSTVESLLKLTTEDKEEEEQPKMNPTQLKNRPVSSRQVKIDKKKAKKQRATEKHRSEIIATAGKKSDPPNNNNNEQEPIVPANMEFIHI